MKSLGVGQRPLQLIIPWVISALAILYVLNTTDWKQVMAASDDADLPLFVLFAALDKIVFFAVWTWVQIEIIRGFVGKISRTSLISVRGASEGFRAVNNPLADAIFLAGTRRITRASFLVLFAALLIPFAIHFMVLLLQTTILLPMAPAETHPDGIKLLIFLGWSLVVLFGTLWRISQRSKNRFLAKIRLWLTAVSRRQLVSYLFWFIGLALFDVIVQGFASRSFGINIDWWCLAARLPFLYLGLTAPSIGNFGVREFVWSTLFQDQASSDALVAYAFSMNALFVLFHVVIGGLFFQRAWILLVEIRSNRREGKSVPTLREMFWAKTTKDDGEN